MKGHRSQTKSKRKLSSKVLDSQRRVRPWNDWCRSHNPHVHVWALEPTHNSHVAQRILLQNFLPRMTGSYLWSIFTQKQCQGTPPAPILYTMGLNYKINNISVTSRSGGNGQFRAEQFLQIPDICPVTTTTIIVVFWMGNATHRLLCLNAWYPAGDMVLEGGALWALQN